MTEAFLNESVSPKLLPHKFPYVEALVDQIEGMENNIARETDKTKLKITAHRMELYRIAYIVNSYLRYFYFKYCYFYNCFYILNLKKKVYQLLLQL